MQQEQSGSQQYLTFMLGGETYGIGIMAVKEIIEFSGITEVPMMPESIRGVINLRGAVVPVMDLAARFGKPQSVAGKRTCIVIVELDMDGERQVTGVVVDAVMRCWTLPMPRSSRRHPSAPACAATSSPAWARSTASS
jgi:purine-binding chemotaxis protein CheW